MASAKDYKKALDHIRSCGYTIVVSTHIMVYDDQGRFVMAVAKTPSDHRSVLNLRTSMKKAGIPPMPGKNIKKKADR